MTGAHCATHLLKVLGIIDTIGTEALTLAQIVKAAGVLNAKLLVELFILTGAQLIEDVEVALLFDLTDHAGLFQKKVGDLTTVWFA